MRDNGAMKYLRAILMVLTVAFVPGGVLALAPRIYKRLRRLVPQR